MKDFVEFGHETSHRKSSSHAEFKTCLKMEPYGAYFHFVGLFCYKALTVKSRENVQKTLFRGGSYKMPKMKKVFFS